MVVRSCARNENYLCTSFSPEPSTALLFAFARAKSALLALAAVVCSHPFPHSSFRLKHRVRRVSFHPHARRYAREQDPRKDSRARRLCAISSRLMPGLVCRSAANVERGHESMACEKIRGCMRARHLPPLGTACLSARLSDSTVRSDVVRLIQCVRLGTCS